MNERPQSAHQSRRFEAMLVLEAVAPLLVGVAAIVILLLAFVGSSPNYP